MPLKFGPQWLRDLSDGGTSLKFKLADYRYGREEMLALFNEHSTPPDQVRKHLSIFSKEIQKPITMFPFTGEEQRLVLQGFNSTVVLRAASRGSGPPLRPSRGGGPADRGRGRGRGRGEGYMSRTENGEIPGFSRSAQDGWEQVGRKFERSFSRGYDDVGPKREYIRSSSDNWRDKRFEEDEEEEEGSAAWRNNRERWAGLSTRTNWREAQRENYEVERRSLHPRGFEPDSRGVQRANENFDNEGDVPEWVADDVGDDPGTFDSSGAFVSTRQGKKFIELRKPPPTEDSVKQDSQSQEEKQKHSDTSKNSSERHPSSVQSNKAVYVPPKARNGNGDSNDSKEVIEDKAVTDPHSETQISFSGGHSNKGDGDSGFAIPNPELVHETRVPPGQNLPCTQIPSTQSPVSLLDETVAHTSNTRVMEMDRLHLEKSLQNLVAEMTAGAERRAKTVMETSPPCLPVTNEDSNKWFYKDPQGEVQGPFTNEEMAQWFSAGYFTMSLIVKRGCDDLYKPLGELIKRYGRVPFLPGPPLPPLISGNIAPEKSLSTTPPLSVPPLVPPLPAPLIGTPLVSDPHIMQQMLMQQEFLKQTYLRKLQQLQQLQDSESFKALPPEQQYIPMQMLMQANPLLMQHQLLLQQQQQQQQQQDHSLASAAYSGEGNPAVFQHMSSNNSSLAANTPTPTNIEEEPAWPNMSHILPGMWPIPTTQIPPQQPTTSLWDIDMNSSTLSPAYRATIETLRRDRDEERLKEEEKAREEELHKKKEELLRQQEEIERQREQMRREKEDLERQRQVERQKQLEIQKIEEARRQEEDKIRLEIERQSKEKQEEEKRLQELARKQLEAERKKEKELEKLEKKKRKEEERRLEEEKRKSALASAEKIVAQYEQCKESRKKVEEEMIKQEFERQQKEERMLKESADREKMDSQKKQQNEAVRQQESLKKFQKSQKDQLANIQLPPSSNWAALQQTSPMFPSQSKSLTEIQEEARHEEERFREQQMHMQRIQEQMSANQSQQFSQKSWATPNNQAMPSKGLSLLHIQQQEAEKAKKSEKEKTNNNTYTSKVALSSTPPTWTGSAGTWGGVQPIWNTALSSNTGFWDSVAAPTPKKSAVKESGEFPALKTPAQQTKKTNMKDVKASNVKPVAKLKKEEESVQKLFQNRQQDDFSQWVTGRVNDFSASIDVPTFVSFIVEVDSPDEVQDYIKTYLGDSKESREFAKKFIEKRNKFRNQARLVKQQEEDSIWGPAPAVNPHNQVRGSINPNNINTEGRDGTTAKAKNRKKKQKMQKLDGSILGFTVQADPNRKNAAGEFEVIE